MQALPQWKALAMMRHPIALSVVDCAAVPNIVAGTKCKVRSLGACGLLRTTADAVVVYPAGVLIAAAASY